jgi:hypothetical protein
MFTMKNIVISIIIFICLVFIKIIFINKYTKLFESLTNNKIPVILLGDSVLNNSNYVTTNDNTVEYNLQTYLGKNYEVINNAQDGTTIAQCFNQLDNLNIDKYLINSSTIIILSCGGNNILQNEQPSMLENNFKTLIQSIKAKFPYLNKFFVLDLYKPLISKYNNYYPQINEWNTFLIENSVKYKYNIIKISDVIVDSNDLIYDIEPSKIGSKKLAKIISKNIID